MSFDGDFIVWLCGGDAAASCLALLWSATAAALSTTALSTTALSLLLSLRSTALEAALLPLLDFDAAALTCTSILVAFLSFSFACESFFQLHTKLTKTTYVLLCLLGPLYTNKPLYASLQLC